MVPLVTAVGAGIAALVVFLGVLELALAVAARGDEASGGDDEPNAYVRELRRLAGAGGRYVDTLFPHPYLGWVHHGNPPDGVRGVNNVGLLGRDFPAEKDDSAFVVLLTGGSVAAQLGQLAPDGPRYLEEALNRGWTAGGGRRFVVLNGAAGAWKQPQQAILFLLHCDVVDAVVTLDGWNEHYALTGAGRLEMPADNFATVSPLAVGSRRDLLGAWLAGELERRLRARPLLARSHVVRHAAGVLRRALVGRVARPAAGGRRTTVESLFTLPARYSATDVFRHALRSYVKYLVSMTVLARQWGVKSAHFLQPVPALGKELTAAERAVVGDLGYRERYARMVEELLRLGRIDVPVFSLVNLFAECRETMYADWIHLERDARTGESPGYRLMAERMAAELARAWGLVPRAEGAGEPAAQEETAVEVVCVPGPGEPGAQAMAESIVRGAGADGVRVVLGRGVGPETRLVHLLGLGAYRVTHALAMQAMEAGLAVVLSPRWADWASFRVDAEAAAQRVRARLGLAPTVDLEAYARTHEEEVRERLILARTVARHARRVVATGASEEARLRCDLPGARTVTIPVGVPARPGGGLDAFVAKYGTRDFVLCVGRLDPRKNQLALLEALADDPVDVVLATGGIAHRPDYLEACQALRRRGRTLYLPHLTDEELAAAYGAARVHVLPSWHELPGLPTLEALAAGAAVVATDRGTVRDHLGDTIPYAPPDDPAALRRAIEAAGGWSFTRARERAATCTAARTAAAWRALYVEILGELASEAEAAAPAA